MNSWFFYFLKKSISQRKGRFIISSAAVMLTVMVVTALVTLSTGIRDKIGAELKQYGANMIVTDSSGKEIDQAVAEAVKDFSAGIRDAVFQIYDSVSVKGITLEIVGMDPRKMTGYRLLGTLPRGEREIMAGVTAGDVLGIKPGSSIRFDGSVGEYRVTAVFEKGSDEDSFLVLPIQAARDLVKKSGVSAVLLNANTKQMKHIEDKIRSAYPFLQVKTLRQVAVAEERILTRIQLLMLLVTAVVLISSVIALGSTMGANVIERREEIGLMKSLGATREDIRNFFMIETTFSGLAGSLAGYCTGILAAEAVSKTAFGSFVPVNASVILISVFLGLSIAILATYFPVRDAMKIVPAEILRGE